MALTTRIDPIGRDIEVMINDLLSPAAQSRAVAAFARDEIAQADLINARALGRVPDKVITVDGSRGATLDRVRPEGVIVAEWEIFTDVLVWIAQTLAERSPRLSGEYLMGHRLFADGSEIAVSNNPPPAAEYTFLNVAPYSRKIEVGKTKAGRPFVVQVPNRIYERVAKDARARFGNIADIRLSYRETTNAYQVRGRRGGSSALRAPAIIVKIKGS